MCAVLRVLSLQKQQLNANFFYCFCWNTTVFSMEFVANCIVNISSFFLAQMNLYNYCYYILIAMAIQREKKWRLHSTNRKYPRKPPKSAIIIICVAFQCSILMKTNLFSFRLFHAPNYTKITVSYRHCVHKRVQKRQTHIQNKGMNRRRDKMKDLKSDRWKIRQRDIREG